MCVNFYCVTCCQLHALSPSNLLPPLLSLFPSLLPLPCFLLLFSSSSLLSSSPPTFLTSLLHVRIFVSSWDTLAWPRHIVDQVEQSEEQLEQDEQKFHKKLFDVCVCDDVHMEVSERFVQVSNLNLFTFYSLL